MAPDSSLITRTISPSNERIGASDGTLTRRVRHGMQYGPEEKTTTTRREGFRFGHLACTSTQKAGAKLQSVAVGWKQVCPGPNHLALLHLRDLPDEIWPARERVCSCTPGSLARIISSSGDSTKRASQASLAACVRHIVNRERRKCCENFRSPGKRKKKKKKKRNRL